jgi:hypothetical protein
VWSSFAREPRHIAPETDRQAGTRFCANGHDGKPADRVYRRRVDRYRQDSMARLRDRVAIVTGAGSSGPGWGNGKATAVTFAREGAKIFAVDIRACPQLGRSYPEQTESSRK